MARVRSVHERAFAAPRERLAPLLDGLASDDDLLWPHERWPPMRLEPRLQAGARGGHGPIRYDVETYWPGRSVRFRFLGPRGFEGVHAFELHDEPGGGCRLRHVLELSPRGPARLTWPLVFRPLHDALIEDALDRAAAAVGELARPARWPLRVRLLRALLRPAARRAR